MRILRAALLGLVLSPLPAMAQSEPPARVVLVRSVTLEPVARERSLTGTIRPRVETDLAFRVAGKVIRRHVDAGQIVPAGTVLADWIAPISICNWARRKRNA